MRQRIKAFFEWVAGTPIGVLWGFGLIVTAGAIIIFPFTLAITLRAMGRRVAADRVFAWIWKRTTLFHF